MNKTGKTRYFILGMAVTLILCTTIVPAIAANITKQLEATYRDIKIVIDGNQITPKDANGNVVEPFVVDGTTYLPVRAVGEAFGKSVEWDGNTNTVYLGAKSATNPTPTPTPTPAPGAPGPVETKQYTGRLDSSDSVNTYDFSLPYASRVTIDFEHEYVDRDFTFWKIQFIAMDGGVVIEFDSNGKTMKTASPHAAYLPAGEYMVRISPPNHNSASYTVSVNYQKNNGSFETEDNGTQESANTISVGNAMTGNILSISDVDYYKITIPAKMDISIDLTHEFLDRDFTYWKTQLISSDDAVKLEFNANGKVIKTTSDMTTLEPGEYFVRISPPNHSPIDYTFVVNQK